MDEQCRSRTNVPIRIGSPEGDEALEKKFLEEATKAGLVQLKGHRYEYMVLLSMVPQKL